MQQEMTGWHVGPLRHKSSSGRISLFHRLRIVDYSLLIYSSPLPLCPPIVDLLPYLAPPRRKSESRT
ncbi:hypothetical protein R1flu_012985 [Riccia fluitans]|uniref:Uncharacterized protein n=1 Tax=Riccia fluitans TaxID=41844 RepID=A0ABD1ZCG3_9MARC